MKHRLAAALALLVAACATSQRTPVGADREALKWPLFGPSVAAPPSPGADRVDVAAVLAWQARRTDRDLEAVRFWDNGASAWRWDAEARRLLTAELAPTVRAARVLGALHLAMADAATASWQAREGAGAPPPGAVDARVKPWPQGSPEAAWPSAQAAVAGAAAGVLAGFFPVEAAALAKKADVVGETRVAAGEAFPADVAAGLALGRTVAEGVNARLQAEGDGTGVMTPKAGGFADADPELPGVVRWGFWLGDVPSPGQPPAPETLARELAEVVALNQHLGIRERNVADKWLAAEPAGVWAARAATLVERDGLELATATRRLAWVDLAIADAATASWKLAYTTMRPRPQALAPALETVRFTPGHPAWPDDGAAIAGAASTVLAACWPAEAAALKRDAQEAAEAGFDGAQHYKRDGVDGLALGVAVGQAVAARMAKDAATP